MVTWMVDYDPTDPESEGLPTEVDVSYEETPDDMLMALAGGGDDGAVAEINRREQAELDRRLGPGVKPSVSPPQG